jgi:xanthine dehydrogenase accessory factor
MNLEFYIKLKALLLAGESPTLVSALSAEELGKEQLVWQDKTEGEVIIGEQFSQVMTAPARLVICGGGHVARELAPAALRVGFAVTVLEERANVLAEGNFPPETDLRCGDFPTLLQEGNFPKNAFFAIMTQGHTADWVCLKEILRLPHAYLGLMGSRRKIAGTRTMLEKEGFGASALDGVHTPIGLSIGAETPAEIAVSIVAELIQCRSELGLEAPLDSGVAESLSNAPYAMVTLVNCSGSTPRSEGARMLVFPDGSIRGTIGGGISEAVAKRQAIEALAEGKPRLGHYALDESGGSICGGRVTYLIIPVKEDGTC